MGVRRSVATTVANSETAKLQLGALALSFVFSVLVGKTGVTKLLDISQLAAEIPDPTRLIHRHCLGIVSLFVSYLLARDWTDAFEPRGRWGGFGKGQEAASRSKHIFTMAVAEP